MSVEYGYKSLGIRHCAACGKPFEASTRHRKKTFCSLRCSKTGDNNPSYKKNNDISRNRLHRRIESIMGRPDKCSLCGATGAVDLANISNEYKNDVSDWEWLCRKCHMSKDGRLEATRKRGIDSRKRFDKPCAYCRKMFMPSKLKTRYCSNSCGAFAQHAKRRTQENKAIRR